MKHIYISNSATNQILKKYQVDSRQDFYNKYIQDPYVGEKGQYYFTTVNKLSEEYRLLKNHLSSWCICIDGDKSTNLPGCVPTKLVHDTLCELNINHILYTSPSHNSDVNFNRWRLIVFCNLEEGPNILARHRVTVANFYKTLDIPQLIVETSSSNLVSEWFLPIKSEYYRSYIYLKGNDFPPNEDAIEDTIKNVQKSSESSKSIKNHLDILLEGGKDTGVNDAILAITANAKKSSPEFIKEIINRLIPNPNKRQQDAFGEMERALKGSYITAKDVNSSEWTENKNIAENIHTIYPQQDGVMEDLVQFIMNWMMFPERSIAIISSHIIISCLGGRTYTLPDGGGITINALITGDSTSGKSFIRKSCMYVLDNFYMFNKVITPKSSFFVGDAYYTSYKYYVDDILKKPNLISFINESGHMDQSSAGDMVRVKALELELATNSGKYGYISGGGQKEKVPALFSPAVTCIRESVPEVQFKADIKNKSTISGVAGRRHHIILPEFRGYKNYNRKQNIPQHIRKKLKQLFDLYQNDGRSKVISPISQELWVHVKYEDIDYIQKLEKEWIDKHNMYKKAGDKFSATFYGRLFEKIPGWAARLAIIENPNKPVITNNQLDIAYKSILIELSTYKDQLSIGKLDTDLDKVINKIQEIFSGDLLRHNSLKRRCSKKMLKDGVAMWSLIILMLKRNDSYKNASQEYPHLPRLIQDKIKDIGLEIINKTEAADKYNTRALLVRRT